MATHQKFWMVYVEGGNAPAHKHWSLEQASNECDRLATRTSKSVYVLEAVAGSIIVRENIDFIKVQPHSHGMQTDTKHCKYCCTITDRNHSTCK